MSRSIGITVTNDLIQDQRMHRICQTLTDDGYAVTLIGRKKGVSMNLESRSYEQVRLKCFFERGVFFYLEYNIRLMFYLLRNRHDLLYSVDLDTIGAVGVVAQLKGSKHIHDAHEYFVEVPELKGAPFKKWIWNRIGRSFLSRADLRFTVNEELASELARVYHCPFGVVRSVPHLTDDVSKTVVSSPKVILYQGMLNRGRGLEVAIKAIANSDLDVQLLIAGEGDLSEELRSLAEQVDKDKKITFLGWILPHDLQELTRTAWLGLNLLDATSKNYEYSLANKFFDYIHAGVPSINMAFPTYKRYLREYNVGASLEHFAVEDLHYLIFNLYHDENRYLSMVAATEKARKKYNWQIESKALLSQIKTAIDG